MKNNLEHLKQKPGETICQWAYRLLEGVPEGQWIKGHLSDYNNKCCAWGHLRRLTSPNPLNFQPFDWGNESENLPVKIRQLGWENGSESIISINDNAQNPKKEVLDHLAELIGKGY